MVKNTASIIAILSNIKNLGFRGQKINLNELETSVLENFSKHVKKESNFRYYFTLPESNPILLRCIISEIFYIAVEKDSGNLFFFTDRAGEQFIKNILQDMHTENIDFKINFLKHLKNKIHFFSSAYHPHGFSSNDILVIFRQIENLQNIASPQREISILTLRDSHFSPSGFSGVMSQLTNSGWKLLKGCSGEQPKGVNKGEKIAPCKIPVRIRSIKSKAISDFFESVNTPLFSTAVKKEYIDKIGFFYLAAPIPLKLYDYYKNDSTESGTFVPSMLPSVSSTRIPHITAQDAMALQAICIQTETALQEKNPKYNALTSAIRENAQKGLTSAVLLPNQLISRGFHYVLFEAHMARGITEEDVALYYPESYFLESLAFERVFDETIIPFAPSLETLSALKNISKSLQLILYPQERNYADGLFQKQKKPDSSIDYAHMEITWDFSTAAGDEDRISRDTDIDSLAETGYNRFLSFLSKGDPKTGDHVYDFDGEIDTCHYQIFSDEEGSSVKLRGWENVILFLEGGSINRSKYSWIAPRAIQDNDSIIIIPDEIRYEFLKDEISQSVDKHKDDLQVLIDYISLWKAALYNVKEKFHFIAIYKELKKAGIDKNYLTIRNWFGGLHEDPKTSTIIAITDSKYNLGPRDPEDIKRFGEAFNNKKLKENYHEIFAAMKVFRVQNQHIGKITMQKIIQKIEDPDILDRCIRMKVKNVQVTE